MSKHVDNVSVYDNTKDFKTECLPAIVQLKQFCLKRGIPFYMTFATGNSDKGTEYITSKQLPPEVGTTLKEDKFRKIVLAEHGFDLVLNHIDSFAMDDVCDGLPEFAEAAPETQGDDLF